MTEAEWLACAESRRMLEYMRDKVNNRKFRLFVAAGCRTFLPELLVDKRTCNAIEIAEAYADGAEEKEKLVRAKRAALAAVKKLHSRLDAAIRAVTHGLPKREAVEFPYFCLHEWKRTNHKPPTTIQQRKLVQLIRDIFPFRTIILNPTLLIWHDGLLGSMARQIYNSRDFSDMPILADALEDAGCDNAELLAHCRGPGPHTRGCWVIDALLGKS